MAQRPKCMHCETAIGLYVDEAKSESWVHLWSGVVQCLKVTNRKPLGSSAAPRPER